MTRFHPTRPVREPSPKSLKRRSSELSGEAACNQEYAGGLKQGLDNEAEPVIAQSQTSVLKYPGIAAFDRPAPLAQSRPARLTALVDVRLGPRPCENSDAELDQETSGKS